MMDFCRRNIFVLMCFALTGQNFGEQIANTQFKVPLPDEIICQYGGTSITDLVVSCQHNGTCERITSYACMCSDGTIGRYCLGNQTLYWSFDTLDNLTTMERSQQINFDPLVPGKIKSAVSLNLGQWIDLGVHYEACMTDPQSCGAEGGAISIWLRLHSSDDGGFLTTRNKDGTGSSTGIFIGNLASTILYSVEVPGVDHSAQYNCNLNEWFHSVINFIGPNIGQGYILYVNGMMHRRSGYSQFTPGVINNGRIAVGRQFIENNHYLACTEFAVDELLFFN